MSGIPATGCAASGSALVRRHQDIESILLDASVASEAAVQPQEWDGFIGFIGS
jgi:hypothetical protein